MANKGSSLYRRVSLEEQAQHGCSLDAQLENGRKKAEKLGVEIVDIFEDPGVSATKTPMQDRLGLQALLTHIKVNQPKYVFIWKRDRLARSTIEYASIIKSIVKYGTQIIFFGHGEPPFGKGVYGKFQETLIMACAELESQILRQRLIDTRRKRVLSGEIVHNVPPYGFIYDPNTKSYVEISERIAVVEDIFKMYRVENMGGWRIVKYLNNELKIRSAKGKLWKTQAVYEILRNPFYTGCQRASYLEIDLETDVETRVPHHFKSDHIARSIISESDFAEVQGKLCSRSHKRIPREYSTSHLLSGLMYCSNCGFKMTAETSSHKRTLKDGTEKRIFWKVYKCGSSSTATCYHVIKQDKIEQIVIEALHREFSSFDAVNFMADAEKQFRQGFVDIENRIRSIEQSKTDLKRKLEIYEKLLEAKEVKDINKLVQRFSAKLLKLIDDTEALDEEQFQLENEVKTLSNSRLDEAEFMGKLAKWDSLFVEAGPDERRNLICEAVERVDIDWAAKTVTITTKLDRQIITNNSPSLCQDGQRHIGNDRAIIKHTVRVTATFDPSNRGK